MNIKKKQIIVPFFIMALIVYLVTPVQAVFYNNDSDCAFAAQSTSGGSGCGGSVIPVGQIELPRVQEQDVGIGDLIVSVAACMIESQISLSKVLLQVEIGATVDDEEWKNVRIEIEKAIDYQKILVQVAEATEYYGPIIKKLKNYDYKAFAEKNGVKAKVFNGLVVNLAEGNVRAHYWQTLANLKSILDYLENMKVDNPSLHKLSDLHGDSFLQGKYCAMIFSDII